jgi:hypothetical protein
MLVRVEHLSATLFVDPIHSQGEAIDPVNIDPTAPLAAFPALGQLFLRALFQVGTNVGASLIRAAAGLAAACFAGGSRWSGRL